MHSAKLDQVTQLSFEKQYELLKLTPSPKNILRPGRTLTVSKINLTRNNRVPYQNLTPREIQSLERNHSLLKQIKFNSKNTKALKNLEHIKRITRGVEVVLVKRPVVQYNTFDNLMSHSPSQ